MALHIRVEPTFDQEKDAKKRLQYALQRSAGYGLPPIPCIDQAATRTGCYGCGKVIWATNMREMCEDCAKKPTGFQIE